MAYENNDKKMESVYSQRIRAGKRRTYFFDVRATRANDYYLTITESRKRFNEDGYDRHKIFLYKEDFNKFLKGLTETRDHFQEYLKENGIQTVIHYPIPPHKQQAYSEWNNLSFAITENVHQQTLSLPMSPVMTEQEINYVCQMVNAY